MEGLTLFAVCVAFIIIVTARRRTRRLEEQVDLLRARIDSIDRTLMDAAARRPPPAPPPGPTPVRPAVAPTAATPGPQPPLPQPSAQPTQGSPPLLHPPPQAEAVAPSLRVPPLGRRAAPKSSRDVGELEAAIGGSWLNRIGVAFLVLGIAFALGYTLAHLGPLGKALTATAVSILMILGGVLLERRAAFEFYGRGLIAGGWAALYATAYAVHELPATRIVDDPRLGFCLLAAVGAGMILHSLRYGNQGLTALAYGLGYAAIVLHSLSAYTLLAAALLGLGTVLHLARRRWYAVAFGGIAATYGSLYLWYLRQPAIDAPTLRLALGALAIDWCVFLVADFAAEPGPEDDPWNARAVAFLNALAAGAFAYLAWHRSTPGTAWQPLLILGAIYAVTSATLRATGRPTVHQIHSLAAALLVAFAARKGLGETGATWIWLAEAQALVLIGVGLKDRFHRMLGCTLFLAPMAAIARDQTIARLHQADGIFDRQRFLLTAAACGCFYLTFSRLRAFTSRAQAGILEDQIRRGFSYAAFALIALATWVQLPVVYVAPAGALLMLLLFELSALRRLTDLRIQCYLAAIWMAIASLAFSAPSHARLWDLPSRVLALVAVAVACLAVFIRQTGGRARVLEEDTALRPLFSWAATLFAALAIWLEARPVVVGPAWLILALVLAETGVTLGEAHLRQPGYAMVLAALASLILSNLTATDRVAGFSVRAATLVPAVAATYYLWWRLRSLPDPRRPQAGYSTDERFGRLLSYLAGALAGLFFRFEFGLDGAALRWSLAMVALLAAGYLLGDADFRLQAYILAAAVLVRAVGFDFRHAGPLLGIDGPLAIGVVGVAAYVGAGCLIQSRLAAAARAPRVDRRGLALEQRLEAIGRDLTWTLAVVLAALYLYRTQSGSTLIVGWALEGLVATGSGLALGSRGVRLAGLALLAIAVARTLVRAFTTFDTPGRIISFIVLGLVLLLISFAYTRYRHRLQRTP